MRALVLAILTGLCWAAAARAFEVEADRTFPAAEADAERIWIVSSTDLEQFAPAIAAFQARHPRVAVRYTVASSTEVFRAVAVEQAAPDLVISSAMDLQVKLANDGMAAAWRSGATASLPPWARWRDQVIAFTEEAAVVVARRDAFAGGRPPETRQALIDLLSAHPERFRGRIGTYDVRASGLGYLFATEDARLSDSFWRLMQEMGNLSPRLYCCSGEMIAALENGTLAIAYNVLGSYARPRVAGRDELVILPMRDFTNVMMRTAVIPARAPRPELAGAFIDFLLSATGRRILAEDCGLPPLGARTAAGGSARPIRLGPGLLVYLDRLKRQAFLAEWAAAMVQP